jgi:hypothetical protein
VIEGLLHPLGEGTGFPVHLVEVDGNLLPPNLVNKLEIFMLNVLRFGRSVEANDLVCPAASRNDGSIQPLPASPAWAESLEKGTLAEKTRRVAEAQRDAA